MSWGPAATAEDFGEQNDLGLSIRVCTGLPQDEERETFLHELLHAIDGQLGIDRPEEEHNLRSVGLYAAMRDNPHVVDYLFGDA